MKERTASGSPAALCRQILWNRNGVFGLCVETFVVYITRYCDIRDGEDESAAVLLLRRLQDHFAIGAGNRFHNDIFARFSLSGYSSIGQITRP